MGYIYKRQKNLRCGYTTGSCAAGAAKAAAQLLLGGISCQEISLMTPKGILLNLPVGGLSLSEDRCKACCYVKKDSGDDPDITNGCLIYASVSFQIPERFLNSYQSESYKIWELSSKKIDQGRIFIDGGKGVGRITKKGLEQPIGAAAINHVPRQMITKEVLSVCEDFDFSGQLYVEISVPNGEELAEHTFNPHLGILGGISILGTSGIVEPMSEQALLETIRLELRVQAEESIKFLLLTPGNYGMDFLQQEFLDIFPVSKAVKCSNFIGETLDYAVECGFQEILLVGHAGKIIKLAAGIMNTHSRYADGRMEIIAVHATLSGAEISLVEQIMTCTTVDAALEILCRAKLLEKTMASITEKILFYLKRRVGKDIKINVIYFSPQYGVLGNTIGCKKY